MIGSVQVKARVEEYVDKEFDRADLNHDGVIDADEFMLYYFSEICFKFPVGKNGFNPGVRFACVRTTTLCAVAVEASSLLCLKVPRSITFSAITAPTARGAGDVRKWSPISC
jgi:hypothetical protein